jgi:hypothetical protein
LRDRELEKDKGDSMKLKALVKSAPWLSKAEQKVFRALVRGMVELFGARGVVETPLLALRVDDVCVSFLLVRRAEMGLVVEVPKEENKKAVQEGKTPPAGADQASPVKVDKKQAAKTVITSAATMEAVGRARERMRKAMKELEESCAKMGKPVDVGIADVMKPIMMQGAGVMEKHMRKKYADHRKKVNAKNKQEAGNRG